MRSFFHRTNPTVDYYCWARLVGQFSETVAGGGFRGTMRKAGCAELLGELRRTVDCIHFLVPRGEFSRQRQRTKGDFMAGMLPGVECARRRRFHQGGSLNLLHSGKDERRSRRSSFCLYQSHQDHSAHDSHSARHSDQQPQPHWTTRPAMQPRTEQHGDDNRLYEAAREARERLDERLRTGSSSNRRRGSFWDRHSQHEYNHGHICDEERRGVKCSEEEVWPTSIRGWLASVVSSTEARRSAESVKSSPMGLGKATIDLLQRETFTSKEKTNRKYNWIKLSLRASQQEECPVCLESFEPGQVLMHLACAHRFHSNCLIPWLNTHSHCPCCRTKISMKASP